MKTFFLTLFMVAITVTGSYAQFFLPVSSTNADANNAYYEAVKASFAVKPAMMRQYMKQVLDVEPNHASALILAAVHSYSWGGKKNFAMYSQMVQDLDPNYLNDAEKELQKLVGRLANNWGTANPGNHLERLEIQYPDQAQVSMYACLIYQGNDNYRQVGKWANKMVALAPNVSTAHYFDGQGHMAKQQCDKAAAAFDKALSMDSQSPWNHYGKGMYYFYCTKEYDKAAQYFQGAVDNGYNRASTWVIKAQQLAGN